MFLGCSIQRPQHGSSGGKLFELFVSGCRCPMTKKDLSMRYHLLNTRNHCLIDASRFWHLICIFARSSRARTAQRATKFKKSQGTKSWNQINQFHAIFLTKFHFLQLQKWPKINFWIRKKFLNYQNFFDSFDFTNFFAWTLT